MTVVRLGILLAVMFAAVPAIAAESFINFAKDPAYVTFSGGWFDANRQKDQGGEFSLEYRSDKQFFGFKPFVHGAYVTNGMSFMGAGVLMDVQVGDNWIIQPSFAPTWWRGKTDDLDLGYALEFRTRIELAYRFHDRSRLGLAFSHSSNASLGDTNPGTESVMLSVSVPTTMMFGH